MAIQQRVTAALEIVGDGSSTTFSFELRDLFGLNFDDLQGTDTYPFSTINLSAVPDNVRIGSSFFGTAPSSASISGKTITLTWSTAPTGARFLLYLQYNG